MLAFHDAIKETSSLLNEKSSEILKHTGDAKMPVAANADLARDLVSYQNSKSSTTATLQNTHIPPLLQHLLDFERKKSILWIAPHSNTIKHPAIDILPTGSSEYDLQKKIEQNSPSTIVVGDQSISEASMTLWAKTPAKAIKKIIRRGTSINGIPSRICSELGIQVVNTPGVNAKSVAAFAADRLLSPYNKNTTQAPRKIGVLGDGAVGRALVQKILTKSEASVVLFARTPKSLTTMGIEKYSHRITVVDDMRKAFEKSSGVAICVALNKETEHLVSASHIRSMDRGAHLVCISRPALLSDDAVKALAEDASFSLSIDYGPKTLHAFRERLDDLKIPQGEWGKRLSLTSAAAANDECLRDLDNAVLTHVAQSTIDRFVTDKLNDPNFSLRIQKREVTEGPITIVGRGIQGMFQALIMHNAGYRVTVTGMHEGASHKANIRQGSATETIPSRPNVDTDNPALVQNNAGLVIRMNMYGVKIMQERFLRDNPEFHKYFTDGLVRSYTGKESDSIDQFRQFQIHQDHSQQLPDIGSVKHLASDTYRQRYGIAGIESAIETPGYAVKLLSFMNHLEEKLSEHGVIFKNEKLSAEELTKIQEVPSIIALGSSDKVHARPLSGWFTIIPHYGKEAPPQGKGIKIVQDYPVGVLNILRDGDHLTISGGIVPHDASSTQKAFVLNALRSAIAKHFPQATTLAKKNGEVTEIQCERPSSSDGLPVIRKNGQSVVITGTTAGGTTLAPLMSLLAHDALKNS